MSKTHKDNVTEIDEIMQRKKDGIDIPLSKNVQSRSTSNFLEYVKLIHNALPEIDFEEINLETNFLNHKFDLPLIIDSMTGGTTEASKINGRLGKIAEKYHLGMGLGSQRAGLKSSSLAETYSIARNNAPTAFIFANIGGAQISKGLTLQEIQKIIDMIKADAVAIHLNPLQELIQPEGEPRYRGVLDRITEISEKVSIPVIVKEVGAGISKEVALKLKNSRISAINVSGVGGTSWAAVERMRAEEQHDNLKTHLGDLFWDWGLPTAQSLIETKSVVQDSIPIIASGGLRTGLEVCKCLVLGANVCAMAYPFLKSASESIESLERFMERISMEIKSTMFLTGCQNINQLSKLRYILTGELEERVINR